MQKLYYLSRVYETDHFCMKSKKGVENKMGKMREKKPVALNCFVAVKTKKFKYCEEYKECLLVFIQKYTLLKDFQLNIQIKSIQ